MQRLNLVARSVLASSTMLCWSTVTHALEITAGDYEPLPVGMNALLVYAQHAESSDFYSNGQKVSDDFRLKTDVSLLRYIHSFALSNNAVIEPQFILPYGHLKAGGEANALGQTTGAGDLILGAPVKWTLATANKDVFSVAPYLYLPTGSYENDDTLNLGENRWRLLLQAAYIHHFNARWALDTAADVSWFSDNDDYGSGSDTLAQKTRYEYQAYLSYNVSPQTRFAVGGGHIDGGENRVGGVNQDDQLSTTYLRVSATHMLTPSIQVQAVLGRDVEVEEGFREKSRLNLRLAKLF
ncbi:phenol degradation protein meta [Pseudomonas syringae]|uniref:Transporter n=2 Tax=Pseudomonas TaxID=286 RepID=A0AAJ4B5E0_PSESX|nr:transporter [Pseudomonas syringae]MCH5509811.1 transporter [Pseudomonas syringae pv. syringae]MCH5638521.1 transporter [Pseudomonas syringae pv. syringae]PBP49073.1 transporter [Pseudomonas syringae]QHF10927.1 transporter [Pseudomonas syringae UB303]RXU00391.1 phenol degradation protein meta [Pseudomonas syringae]